MAYASITKVRRALRKKASGKNRRKQLEKKGTTPKFPIEPPKA